MYVPANNNRTTLNSKHSIQNGVTTTMSNRVYTKFRHVLTSTARVEYVHTNVQARWKGSLQILHSCHDALLLAQSDEILEYLFIGYTENDWLLQERKTLQQSWYKR